MVEYYDPDRGPGGGATSPSPADARVEPSPGARRGAATPVVEWVVIAITTAAMVLSAWAQGQLFGRPAFGWLFLLQTLYPFLLALLTAAVVSLLLRRLLRRQREELTTELRRLHDELAALRPGEAGTGP